MIICFFCRHLDPKVAARRKKYGGNKKQNYTEGWIEFLDKAVAKQVAKVLNTTIIGGKKNSHYHDDIWNIKYLPKFKWDHLTERIGECQSRAICDLSIVRGHNILTDLLHHSTLFG